eukprot:gb/GEZN01003318.1/.p1 GENE.gb/GEZN01003318.1/~~gb/GEZN01003318.1/.p1  ORF type:complete len:593 (-),score=84.24 gb/GEZN01003318.1/:358-2136(-)
MECSICCEGFDDQKLCPRLLRCGHSFCSGCLEKLIDHNSVTCPTCRKAVAVLAGVTGLPKNFALLDILLASPKQEEQAVPSCETCDGDEQHPATSSCLDCKENMCKEAARWHARNKTSRNHRVLSLEELKANPKLAAVPMFCLEHNEPFRFFDQDCSLVVCRDCFILMHNGHKCSSLAEAASKRREEMGALATKAAAHAKDIKAAEDHVVNVNRNLNHKHQQETAKIRAAFEELRAAITARERALLSDLDQHHKAKELTLTEQRERLRVFLACLESAVQRVNTAVKSPGDAQLLVASSDITSTLAAMAAQPPVLEPLADDALEFSVDHERVLGVLNKAGVVSDKSTSAATTTAAGSGLEKVRPGQEASFTITARDGTTAPRGVGGDTFVVELHEAKGGKVEAKLEDRGDGTYVASYTPPADDQDSHTLSVLLRGSHIQGSPFKVCVLRSEPTESAVTFTSASGYYANYTPQSTLTDDENGWASPAISELKGQKPWLCYQLTSEFSELESVEMSWSGSDQCAKLIEVCTSVSAQGPWQPVTQLEVAMMQGAQKLSVRMKCSPFIRLQFLSNHGQTGEGACFVGTLNRVRFFVI